MRRIYHHILYAVHFFLFQVNFFVYFLFYVLKYFKMTSMLDINIEGVKELILKSFRSILSRMRRIVSATGTLL